jgi:hypothetical protein
MFDTDVSGPTYWSRIQGSIFKGDDWLLNIEPPYGFHGFTECVPSNAKTTHQSGPDSFHQYSSNSIFNILPSSALLHGVRWFETDVSRLPISSIIKVQAVREENREVKRDR